MEKRRRVRIFMMMLLANMSFVVGQTAMTSCDSLSNYSFPEFKNIDTSLRSTYPFIQFTKNNYSFHSKSSANFINLNNKIEQIATKKKGKLNFYHIGGSHIQADIYSNDMREFLQGNWAGVSGERGWVFPFDLAKTNNPANYEFSSPNAWRTYRSVAHKPSKYNFDYGLMGMGITCPDTVINIQFRYDRAKSKPPINHIRVFHNIGEFAYWMHFGEDELLVTKSTHNPELGYTDVFFADNITAFDVEFQRKSKEAPELEIYGFILMNDLPGFSYSSIGINGAGLYTYLDNIRFEEQLKTYPPDFFAYSVGTNDGNVSYDDFNPAVYKANLEKMMKMALRANPECALLLTVPNDAYYHKRYLNRNIAREREVIIELAEQYNMAVWDLYGVMGELGSSKTWKLNGLMQSDYVHFTSEGYHLKGSLFIDSFLKYLDHMNQCTTKNSAQ